MPNQTDFKRKTSIASFCAMTCAEGGFHKFLQDVEGVNVTDPASAKDYILSKCGIEIRTELNTKGPEQESWLSLQAHYKDWLKS